MFFIIIRLIILLLVLFPLLRKERVQKSKNKKTVAIILSAFLLAVSALIPFENLFVTFSTAESSYKYHNQGTPVTTVDGQDTSLVVGQKGNTYIYNIIPKADNGWKLGMGYNMKNIYQSVDSADKNLINVFQYKNTNEFYFVVTNIEGENLQINDSINSEFVLSETSDKKWSASDCVYYAYVNALGSDYVLSVNGVDIPIGESVYNAD